MAYQTIAKPLGLIKDLKLFVHGIPYMVTFIVINNNVLDSSYLMLLGRPWLKVAKVSHDWGTNIVTIQGANTVRTIPITKKLGIQTKRPKVLIYYDFHYGIFANKEDVMFATRLDLFSIGTIAIPTHTKPIPKPVHILNIIMVEPILKQHVIPIYILVVKLATPPYIVK